MEETMRGLDCQAGLWLQGKGACVLRNTGIKH